MKYGVCCRNEMNFRMVFKLFQNRLIEHNAVLSAASHLYLRVNVMKVRLPDFIVAVYFQKQPAIDAFKCFLKHEYFSNFRFQKIYLSKWIHGLLDHPDTGASFGFQTRSFA